MMVSSHTPLSRATDPVEKQASPTPGQWSVTVCVSTRNRPEGCIRLLRSIERLTFQRVRPPDLSVVVVDNDPKGSAVVVLRDQEWSLPVEVLVESRIGIPFARNRCVEAAVGADYLAFIDDDCEAARDWLDRLLAAVDRYGVDIATGPQLPLFPRRVPSWARASGLYSTPRHPTGTQRPHAYTHNVLVRTTTLEGMERRFDERLALTGGSDTELFGRMVRCGASIVWVDEAVVYEHVPPTRLTLAWVLRRGFRYGNDRWRRRHFRTQELPSRVAWRAFYGVTGAAELLIGLVGAVVTLVASRRWSVVLLNRAARGAGALAGVMGVEYEEYARVHL